MSLDSHRVVSHSIYTFVIASRAKQSQGEVIEGEYKEIERVSGEDGESQ